MHSFDRHWRAILWTLGIILAAAAVYAVAPMPFKKPYIDPGLALFLAIFFGVPVVALVIAGSLACRQRERLRVQAIAGDTAQMPLASRQPKRASAEVPADEPLNLRWKARGSARVIIANDYGLLMRRPRKADVSLAWTEIRLFEIATARQQHSLVVSSYCVYGSDGRFIEWPGLLHPVRPSGDPSGEAFREKQRALLARIVAHTGLPLRTFNLSLANRVSAEPVASRVFRALGALFFALATATVLLAGILSLAMPLTRTLAFNMYVAGVGVVYGAYLLRLTIRAFQAFTRSATPPRPIALPPLSVSLQPATPVRLKTPPNVKKSLGSLLLGIVLLGVIVPLIYSHSDFPRSYYADQSITNLYGDLRSVVLYGCVVGVLYVLTAIILFLRGATALVADETGLSLGRGKSRPFIPWRDIDVLIANVSPERFVSFTALGNGVAVDWPADARWAQPPLPPDALPGARDAGAQLATIVAERAGVQPTTHWA